MCTRLLSDCGSGSGTRNVCNSLISLRFLLAVGCDQHAWPRCSLQAAMEASTKELQQSQRTLQTQESDLRALKYELGEKDSMVS